jgi:hypothetical protein
MKQRKTPPAAFAAVLTIEESEALAILGMSDTASNRSALRAKLPHTGPPAAPRYLHADVTHYARTGSAPTASRGVGPGVDMKRNQPCPSPPIKGLSPGGTGRVTTGTARNG